MFVLAELFSLAFILPVLVVIVLLFLLSYDKKGLALALTLLFGLLFLWKGRDPVVQHFAEPGAWAELGKNVGYYLLGGFAFSFGKWFIFNRKVARRLQEKIDREKPGDELARKSLVSSFNTYENRSGILKVIAKGGGYDVEYSALRLSGYISTWTIYWPFYAVLIVLEDFLKEVFDFLTRVFGKTFRRLASYAFAGVR